jgi:hypothetical protein
MQKVDDYQSHAQKCRELAAKMDVPEVRDQLLDMAKIWEDLAAERATFVNEHPQFAIPIKDRSCEVAASTPGASQ